MNNLSSNSEVLIQNAVLASRIAKRAGLRLSAHGISFVEFQLMEYLANRSDRGLPRIELAEYMGMSASGVTRMLAPMEKIGLVAKEANARDARQSLVRLTETGRRLHGEARISFEEIAGELTQNLSPEQLELLLDAFRILQ